MKNLKDDVEKLKKLVNMAFEAVKETPEKFQQDAFKLILINLLEGKITSTTKPTQDTDEGDQLLDPLEMLANACKITKDDLKNVISVKENNIEVVCQINGADSHRLIVGSLILLFSYEILFNSEWIKSTQIIDPLKKIGIQDKGGNFSTYLKNYSDLFLKRPSSQEYRLTTNLGRSIAARIISKLSKAEQITKNDFK